MNKTTTQQIIPNDNASCVAMPHGSNVANSGDTDSIIDACPDIMSGYNVAQRIKAIRDALPSVTCLSLQYPYYIVSSIRPDR